MASLRVNIYTDNLYWSLYKFPFVMFFSYVGFSRVMKLFGSGVLGKGVFIFTPVYFSLLTGFEFLSAIFVMACTFPVILGILEGDIYRTFKNGIIASASCFTALLAAVLTQYGIQAFALGGLKGPMKHLTGRMNSHTDASVGDAIWTGEAQPDRLGTLGVYLNDIIVFEFYSLTMTAGEILLLTLGVAVVSYVGLVLLRKLRWRDSAYFSLLALSFIAPASWYLIAFGHSFKHKHIITFLWGVGFQILAPVAALALLLHFMGESYAYAKQQLRYYR